ncbi:hypothetical protein CRUP_011761 [Coryphaenoides rupestris]|nr:hypothetical protein CRUP_011761 [Coryphaenoides rupestris]
MESREEFPDKSDAFIRFSMGLTDSDVRRLICETAAGPVSVAAAARGAARVEREDCSPQNVTLAYYVTGGKTTTVYIASLVVEALNVYGFDKLLSDVRQHAPPVRAVLVPVATWLRAPILRFIGPTDNIYSCSFAQMLEQRLENAFDEAQDKVLETYSRLTVEPHVVFMEDR